MAQSRAKKPTPVDIPSLIKSARMLHTQKALAAILGVDAKTIGRWERGLASPTPLAIPGIQQAIASASPRAMPTAPPITQLGASQAATADFTFIDLFAGIGGIRRGFESAGGRCVFTSEWNPFAQKTYAANFKDDHPIAGDITKVDVEDIPDHDVLVGGFPCFAPGTLVHAARGLIPIENIRKGELVLGHSGLYRKVNAVMLKDGAPTRAVSIGGCPSLETTDEHPFWARMTHAHEPRWLAAKDLAPGCLAGVPLDKTMPESLAMLGELAPNADSAWLAGVWLACGHFCESSPTIERPTIASHAVFKTTPDFANIIRGRLASMGLHNRSYSLENNGIHAHVRLFDPRLLAFLGLFSINGKRAAPMSHHWPAELQAMAWKGWTAANGSETTGIAPTKTIALDMARYARNAHRLQASIETASDELGNSIWIVSLASGEHAQSGADQDYVWAPVLANGSTGKTSRVHNIAVETDESYVVEGALVHNCQPFSIAGVSKKTSMGRAHGFEDKTQGTLFFDVARIIKAKQPKAFMLENVKNLLSHDKGQTFKIIKETLENELGYTVSCRVIDGQHFTPQHRERILIVGFREDCGFNFSALKLPDSGPKLKSILHPQDGTEKTNGEAFTSGTKGKIASKYTITDGLWAYLQAYAAKHKAAGNGFGFGMVTGESVTRTLSARYYKDGSEILVSQGKRKNPRRLTPRECARLMGFPESHVIPVSDTQAYKQFGNSVVVPVMAAVAQHMRPGILAAVSKAQTKGATKT